MENKYIENFSTIDFDIYEVGKRLNNLKNLRRDDSTLIINAT